MFERTVIRSFRYYFFDLPLWGLGIRSGPLAKRLETFLSPAAEQFRSGFISLSRGLGKIPDDTLIDEMVTKALWVKIVRESDAYSSLRMTKKRSSTYFHTEGMETLKQIIPSQRPVFLLTGHIGSFFIPTIAFAHMNIPVFPIARTIGTSHEISFARRLYEKLNYKFSESRSSARYIFTTNSGTIDRLLFHTCKSSGIVWTAIDFPESLYPFKREAVRFLGFRSSLPSGLIRLGLKYNAIFLTAWNTVESSDGSHFYRRLTIDEPIPEGLSVSAILQHYADRLSSVIVRQPWQWAGIPVISEFCEEENTSATPGQH